MIEDFERLHQLASQWLVTFNPAKTEIITLFAKVNKIVHLQHFLSGIVLKKNIDLNIRPPSILVHVL